MVEGLTGSDETMETEHFKDRVGEDTVSSDCDICHAVSCFSCVHGYCTALEKITSGGCVFYKDAEENRRQILKCFYRIINRGRFDLIRKYADTMAAIGLMDKEFESAAQQQDILEHYRTAHLEFLYTSHWADSLVFARPADDELEIQEEEITQPEPDPVDPESEFDNALDKAVFPESTTPESLDEETFEDIDANDESLQTESSRFKVDDVISSVTDSADELHQDELPADYAEDFFDGTPYIYDDEIELSETMERNKEVAQEKADANADAERVRYDEGEETKISVPFNFLYRRIGYPVKVPRQPDPVDLAHQILGAAMIYAAAEDYIDILRMLWSGNHNGKDLHRLIISKWELETMIGSDWYWQFTNISPGRVLDQCWVTAEKREKEKIERGNRRVAAGIEGGDEA